MGSARIATHSTSSPAATRWGRLGWYTRVLLGLSGDEQDAERCHRLAQRQQNPRAHAQRDCPAAAERGGEKADEDELAHADAARREQREQAHNIAEREHARGGHHGERSRKPEAEGEE